MKKPMATFVNDKTNQPEPLWQTIIAGVGLFVLLPIVLWTAAAVMVLE